MFVVLGLGMMLLDSTWLIFAQNGMADLLRTPFIPLAAIGLVFYFTVWLPQKKERAKLEEKLSSLKKNDRVVTIGGIYGTVVNASSGPDLTLKIDESNNTRIRVQRTSISRVVVGEEEVSKSEA